MNFHYSVTFDPLMGYLWLSAFALLALCLFIFSVRENILKAAIRLIFAVLLLLFLSQPQWVKENRKPLKDVVLIAVDKSLSNDMGHRGEISAKAQAYLQSALSKMPGVELRTIVVAAGAADETKIFDEIESGLSDVPLSQRGGTYLLTDGQVADAPSSEFLKSAPLNVILSGSKKDKDREIKILNAPGYSIIGENASLKFVVKDHNFLPNQNVDVTLNLLDGKLQTRNVAIGQEQNWPVNVNTAGQNIFELSVPNVEGELSFINNRAVVNVQGVRNRLHVLLVSGEPYPGARMWRDLLKADPGVDLVHFTILRSPEKIDETPSNELSLIAFPFEELFERKLKNFDLIIMDRFSLNTVLPDYYFQNIKNYVENGGALMEISGPNYNLPNSIFNTSLGPILPGTPNGSVLRQSFKPALTELGKTHPVTLPLTKIPDWGSWLEQMPVTLNSGDVVMTGIDNNPLLILSRVDKGRVAQMTSDQIWLWARGYNGGGPTTELLRRIVHWLMKEPELDENALFAETSGSNIHLRLRAQDTQPELKITNPDGKTEIVSLVKAEDGWLSADVKNAKQGVYKFSDGTRQKIVSLGNTTTPEFSNIVTTDKILAPYASKSGGAMIWAEDRPNFPLNVRRNQASTIVSSEAAPLLPPEAAIILALLAAALLWWLEGRKKP